MHVVADVVHIVTPFDDVTTYVKGVEFATADQLRVTALLATVAVNETGEAGGPCGVTVVDAAPFPLALLATVEMTYETPLVSPVMVQVVAATTVHDALPGNARATYVVPA